MSVAPQPLTPKEPTARGLLPVEEVEAVRESSSIEFRNLEPMRFQGQGGQHWRCGVEWLAKDVSRIFRYKETMLRLGLGHSKSTIHWYTLWESTSEIFASQNASCSSDGLGKVGSHFDATAYRYHVLPSTASTTFSQKKRTPLLSWTCLAPHACHRVIAIGASRVNQAMWKAHDVPRKWTSIGQFTLQYIRWPFNGAQIPKSFTMHLFP